jgi:LysM repeat protein
MILRIALPAVAALGLVSCQPLGNNVDYDTADPYGIPDYSGAETGDYQPVNPPADATYGPAAYEDTGTAPAPPPSAPAPTAGPRSHTVVSGDTLWGLSRKYGVSIDAIKTANGMTSDTVVLGTTLNIP